MSKHRQPGRRRRTPDAPATPQPVATAKHAARHAAPRTPSPLAQAPKLAVRTTVVVSALAVGATGTVVAGGVVVGEAAPTAVADSADSAISLTAADLLTGVEATTAAETDTDRETVSRSADRRDATDQTKVALLSADGEAVTKSEDSSDDDPREIAEAMLSSYGWDSSQFTCLDSLWTKESGWQVDADNPTSSAYGIPQALPGDKMATVGADWQTNPVTQITWGLNYIQASYGSPCSAWAHSQAYNWY
ncbi:lytic transglycosylase domain-containing protein [Nocardioides sp. GY 10127]|uniref:aggregation-promoting factor C-terminal-like domain-containing protein n=1 Tax=Nocardioides sp. GY 10127 TaxID=2569762 RepID=UPI00197E8617|nr:lytic transglycosylase domain-containing protein [Nocardioides sp. GY 10127]